MKYTFPQPQACDIGAVQLVNFHRPAMLSVADKQHCELIQVKQSLEALFSTIVQPDFEPSDFNSHGVSTISQISYSTYSINTTQRAVECVLTKHTQKELLQEALQFYRQQIKFQQFYPPTEPLTIQNQLSVYEVFWDDFRRKLNRCSALLEDFADVKQQFKFAYLHIFTNGYEQIFQLLLSGIYVKVLTAAEPSYLTLKKVFELVQAGGDVVQTNLSNFLITGFQDMIRKSFQAFEQEEMNFASGVQAVMRQVSEICYIITYLSYDQGMCSFHFMKSADFERVMERTKAQISQNRNSSRVICNLIREVYKIIFFDKQVNRIFQKQFMQQANAEKTATIVNLTLIARYCDYYMEISDCGFDEQPAIDRLQAEICQLFYSQLKRTVDGIDGCQSAQLFVGQLVKYQAFAVPNAELYQRQCNYVFSLLKLHEFYQSLLSFFPQRLSLESDLTHTLQNFFATYATPQMPNQFLQDSVFDVVNGVQLCRCLYSLAQREVPSTPAYADFKFQPALACFQVFDADLNVLVKIAFSCCSGNNQYTLVRLARAALQRMYMFASASIGPETAFSQVLAGVVQQSMLMEHYQQYVDDFMDLMQTESPVLIADYETLDMLGFQVLQQEDTEFVPTDSFPVTHGLIGRTVVVQCGEALKPVPPYCDGFVGFQERRRQKTEPKSTSKSQIGYTAKVIEEKILQAMIARICKIQGKSSVEELSQALDYPMGVVRDSLDGLVELDVLQCNDDGKYSFEE